MSIWLATLLAAIAAAVAQLLVPRQLRGRPSIGTLPTAAQPKTSTVQALVLLVEAIAWAILMAVAIAIAASMTGAVEPIDSPTVLLVIGMIATALTVAVVLASAPARAEIRLERRIAQLSKAATAGSLPPLSPSPEMQALMEPIASVNRDIAVLERLGDGDAVPAEFADLHKMRDGLVELFVEKDLARRVVVLRSKAPATKPMRRPVSPIESIGALLLRDRLIALFPAPATAAFALGVYAVSALAAAWLAGEPETGLLARRIASRAGEVVSIAQARHTLPQPDAGTKQPAVLKSIRTANLTFSSFSAPSNVALDVSPPAASRDAAAEQEIAALTLKLEATEAMLERAEQALSEAKAEKQRLLEEAQRTRDVDVATVASDAQLERMAHEAAMAIEEERLRQREIELAEHLAELEETKAALRAEKQRLVAMIEDRRRQAQAWEARVRAERVAAANEARVAERKAIAEQTREATRFELEERRIEERQRTRDKTNVAIATGALPAVTETFTHVPASAPVADDPAELAETAVPARLPGTWKFAAVDPVDAPLPQQARVPQELASASRVVTPPAAQGTIADNPRAALPPMSPLAALECGRVRAGVAALGADTNAGAPESSGNRKAKLGLESARALLECGQALMITGDLTAARLAFEKVAAAGIAKGALALGTTFDPHALAKADLDGTSANTKLARFWYKRALTLSRQ